MERMSLSSSVQVCSVKRFYRIVNCLHQKQQNTRSRSEVAIARPSDVTKDGSIVQACRRLMDRGEVVDHVILKRPGMRAGNPEKAPVGDPGFIALLRLALRAFAP